MDIKRVLASLNEHKVRYVIIGAVAFPVHGYDRTTQDVDIFFEPTIENATRTVQAMEAVGYDFQMLPIEALLQKKTLFRQYVLDADLHPFVTGIDWKTVWSRRVRCIWNGVMANFASLDDLITMKKAAGRGKDLDDLRYLEKIRQLRRQRKRRQRQKKKTA